MIRERLRAWLYSAGLKLVTVDGLASIASRIGELGTAQRNLVEELKHRGQRVTAMAFGERRDEPGTLCVIDAQTKLVWGRETFTLELNTNWPLRSCQIVVLADVDRVDVPAIYRGPNVLGMGVQVAFGGEWLLGERVRVICRLREVGGT